ncbi:hypothetical protein IFVP22_C290313 [Vibrio parahaemolyticus]
MVTHYYAKDNKSVTRELGNGESAVGRRFSSHAQNAVYHINFVFYVVGTSVNFVDDSR